MAKWLIQATEDIIGFQPYIWVWLSWARRWTAHELRYWGYKTITIVFKEVRKRLRAENRTVDQKNSPLPLGQMKSRSMGTNSPGVRNSVGKLKVQESGEIPWRGSVSQTPTSSVPTIELTIIFHVSKAGAIKNHGVLHMICLIFKD